MSDLERCVAVALGAISHLRAARNDRKEQIHALRAAMKETPVKADRKALGRKEGEISREIRAIKIEITELDKRIYNLFNIPYN